MRDSNQHKHRFICSRYFFYGEKCVCCCWLWYTLYMVAFMHRICFVHVHTNFDGGIQVDFGPNDCRGDGRRRRRRRCCYDDITINLWQEKYNNIDKEKPITFQYQMNAVRTAVHRTHDHIRIQIFGARVFFFLALLLLYAEYFVRPSSPDSGPESLAMWSKRRHTFTWNVRTNAIQ